MNPDQIQERIQELGLECMGLRQRYEAFMNLFNAACLANNSQEMDEHRVSIHSIVDQILDNQSLQFVLVRQLTTLRPPWS